MGIWDGYGSNGFTGEQNGNYFLGGQQMTRAQWEGQMDYNHPGWRSYSGYQTATTPGAMSGAGGPTDPDGLWNATKIIGLSGVDRYLDPQGYVLDKRPGDGGQRMQDANGNYMISRGNGIFNEAGQQLYGINAGRIVPMNQQQGQAMTPQSMPQQSQATLPPQAMQQQPTGGLLASNSFRAPSGFAGSGGGMGQFGGGFYGGLGSMGPLNFGMGGMNPFFQRYWGGTQPMPQPMPQPVQQPMQQQTAEQFPQWNTTGFSPFKY